ncbi:hypothetical protein PsYK624_107680 [Phanerochaete sordida]|uniref:Uncharacterized protein n=1 Tax=Phanerochaete sordida TaxID=48140 RepID=A0A9P3GGP6_9APHY|nr:hypothetical protein PsYK624_107680 [Phanerochaete sordida]
MATAHFVNNFPTAVAVTIGEPMNTMFTVGSRSTIVHTIKPGTYTVKFSKMGDETVAIPNVQLVNNGIVDIVALWTAVVPTSKLHSTILPGATQYQTKCTIVNDTPSVAAIMLSPTHSVKVPSIYLQVGSYLELLFPGDYTRTFTVDVDGRHGQVEVKSTDKTVELYLSSIFPKPLHAGIQYYVASAKPEVQASKPAAVLQSYV